MRLASKIAMLLIATTAASTGAWAQKVYRCGSTYSQTPCGEGTTLDHLPNPVDTAASPQAIERENKRQLAAANALEKERKAMEAEAQRRNMAIAKAQEKEKLRESKSTDAHSARKKKDKGPEYFTAKQPKPAKS
jgi:hypothetical protein